MKPKITIRLFGKFSVHCGERELLLHSSGKAKEILSYLAVNRRTPVPRETLASLISGDCPTDRSRKYLRQALWQLRADLSAGGNPGCARIVNVAGGWAELVTDDHVWIDVAEFERAAGMPAHMARGSRSRDMKLLQQAVELYRGELLQGWYQDWCLSERERLKQIYLEILDELLTHFEATRNVEAGVAYATLALRSDPARECTHRSLMRLYCLAGDRASAIHQYERCVETLRTELGMEPDDETRTLAREIRAGHAARGVAEPTRLGPSRIVAKSVQGRARSHRRREL
jgi:DNA-binding SARP family transcriptional activator